MSRFTSAEEVAIESRRVERVYSILARVYDGFFDWALGPGRRRAIQSLQLNPGDHVLEVGVGTGLSLPLYAQGLSVTGIDISAPMLEQARARADDIGRAGVKLHVMDARLLAFADGSFEAVLAPYVISVVPDPAKVMAEIARVVRPGGTVIVVNRFRTENRAVQAFERLLTPLTCWVGFRLDLPLETVTGTPGLTVERIESVNLLGMWKLVVLRRED
jgi:phosphatidylethanolamine/phosphatidyl-N-methylethanolamine N-methyltransferase